MLLELLLFSGVASLSLVQLSSVPHSCSTLCNTMDCSMSGFPVHHQLPELAQTHVQLVMPSNHLILCHPLLLLPSIFPSIKVFSNGSVLHIRWPKFWSFSFSISLSNEYSGLISFRIDWVLSPCSPRDSQESSPAPQFKSINWCSTFFMVQLSHPYMTTGKTIALTRWTFVDKAMSLLFNMLSRLVITFFQGTSVF